MQVIDYRQEDGKYRKATFDLEVPTIGIQIKGMSLLEKNGNWWVAMPSKRIAEPNGEFRFIDAVSFIDESRDRAFKNEALQAVNSYVAEKQVQANSESAYTQAAQQPAAPQQAAPHNAIPF